MKPPHTPVLLNEVLQSFAMIPKEGILLDCTLGYGGHTLALLQKFPQLQIFAIDRDKKAIELASHHLEHFKDRVEIFWGRFSEVAYEILQKYSQKIVGILADIGVSSMQFNNQERGFCFESENLDMRMDINQALNAKDIINTYHQAELERIFRDYGEIREYKKMAALITQERKRQTITSAKALSQLIAKAFKHPKIHPATQCFQALRIEVNDELGELRRFLGIFEQISLPLNTPLSIISFHSLEDRIIKNQFKLWEKSCICPPQIMRCECGNHHQKGRMLFKKPLIATSQEILANPRSRSAKLRTFVFGAC